MLLLYLLAALQPLLLLSVVAAGDEYTLVIIAGEIVANIGAALKPSVTRGFLRIEGHVGRQDHVVAVGQRVGIQVGILVGEHIQIGVGDLAAVNSVDHLLLHHDAAAGGVDEYQMVGDAAGHDAVLGTLEPGKFADMVVIDRDIFRIPADEIMDIQVEKTYLAGREVYSKGEIRR